MKHADIDLRVAAARGVYQSAAEFVADEIFRLQARLNGLVLECDQAEADALHKAWKHLDSARAVLLALHP